MTSGFAGGVGSGMEAFGNVLVKARLQDMQMKAQAASQMEQLNAQIAGNLNLEQFRQKFRKDEELPFERETQIKAQEGAMKQLLAGIQGQKEVEGVKAGYDLQKMDFANDLEASNMGKKYGYTLAEIKARAAAEGKLLTKKSLLEWKVKEHFDPLEHQRQMELVNEKNKGDLAAIAAQGKQADETQRNGIALRAALESAPNAMVDFMLAKKYGLHRDPKTGDLTGELQDMSDYVQAQETVKAKNIATKLQAFARTINTQDPEGAKKMLEFGKALVGGNLESIDRIIADVSGGGAGSSDVDEFLRQLREGTGAAPGAESQPGAESRAASRPETGLAVPEGLPPGRARPDAGSDLGERGRNVLHGVLNKLSGARDAQGNPLVSPDAIVEKGEGSKFFSLTGEKTPDGTPTSGGKRVLSDLNATSTGEKFIFNPQTGSFKEAPAKEAVADPKVLDKVMPNVPKGYENQLQKNFERHAWDAIKEAATSEIGMGTTVQELRKEHPELEVQEDSRMTEELKVALLRLRTFDLMNASSGLGSGRRFMKQEDLTSIISEVNRAVQEAKLGKGTKVTAPKNTIGQRRK